MNRQERYLRRILRWNLLWRALYSGGHLMTDLRKGRMCRDQLDYRLKPVSDTLKTPEGGLMSSRSRGC